MNKFITLMLILISISYSQNLTIDSNKDFDRAVGYYKAQKYNDALSLFNKIENRNDNNTKATASAFFIAKILNEQKKYDDAEKACNEFLTKYSQSKYSSEVKYILIKNYIDDSEYEKAFSKAIDFISSSKSIVFVNETKDIANKIALNYLRSSDVEKLLRTRTNSSINSFLILLTGKLLLQEEDKINALKSFNEITSKYSSSDEYPLAVNLKRSFSAREFTEKIPVVGVILSLMEQNGRDISVASEVLAGIKFAFHEYNTDNNDKIGLMIKDIQRDKTKIIDFTDRMIQNNSIRCIIGPLFSDDVRAVLEETDRSNICIISPTATDDDLKSLNENFYQANPSLTSRGKIFAQYLYFVENKRKLAVLNSIEGYSPLLAENFTEEFEKLGGKIIAKETYKSNSFDLTEQLSRISIVGNSIQGIYAPISNANDASAILSQMVQSGLDISLYGNQDWFLGKGFESSSSLSNKLTFDSDYFINFNDSDFKKFSESFKITTDMDVNRNILYGYDCAKYILTVLRNIDPTRKNIKYKMESGISVTGFHNNISFDSERNNKYLNIVRFNDGVFELVEKFRSGE